MEHTDTVLRRDRALVLVLGLVLFFPGLGNHDLWNPDEPRYTEVAREMLLTGDVAVPHLNGEIYSHKPPLLFWLMSLSGLLTGGLDETAARLPSALSGLLTVLLVFEIGRLLFHRRIGHVAALAFATCFKIPIQARTGQIDMLLTFLVALAIYFWVRGYVEGRPRLYGLFFVFAGLATIAKGPVGLLPPLLSIVAFLLLVRDRDELAKMRIGRGLLIWVAVVLCWLVPAVLDAGVGYLEQLVFKQTVTRYVNPWHHYRPFYYYLTVIPADFFPWAFLLPAALVAGFKRLEDETRRRFVFAVCWMAVTVLFFSLSPAKRTVYILTMYPGMALALAAGLDALAGTWPRLRWWLLGPLAFVALVLAGGAIAVPLKAPERPETALFADWYPLALGLALGLMATAGLVALVLAWRGRLRSTVAALGAGSAILSLAATLVLLPPFDQMKSARPLSEELLARLGPHETYALYPRLEPPFLYYTGRFAEVLETEEALREFARRPGPGWVIAERDELAKVEGDLSYREVAGDANPTGGYVLLRSP